MKFKAKPGIEVFMKDGSVVKFDTKGYFEASKEQAEQLAALGYSRESVTITEQTPKQTTEKAKK